ncbi:MAG: Trk system potassium transporter TrkA [Lachnospiraceae bacterium]|nr:Trk system potassium transporter TrkA [Lachnospiraceae bacterium]
MKIIIAGYGKLGSTLVRQLSGEGYDLTVIESDPDKLEESIEVYDVMGIEGNCASMTALREAKVEEADLLIAMTGQDEINLLSCMTAHHMNPKISTVTRIKNPEYSGQITSMQGAFALSMAVNPDFQAAKEISRLIRYPGFLKRDTFAKSNAEIVELKVKRESVLNGLSLFKINQTLKCQVLVCAVLRGGKAMIPSGDFVLNENDRIFVTGSNDNLNILLKNLNIITHRAATVLIAGGSRIGYYLAQILLKHGIAVQIVESKPKRCKELAALLPDAVIVEGDASDQKVLDREGIGNCDAFVALTGIDETNVLMSIYADHMHVPQTITKLGRAENLRILEDLPVGSTISPKDLVTNIIVRYIRAKKSKVGAALTMHLIADGMVEAEEFRVTQETRHCGEKLKDIRLKKNVLLAGITRRGNNEIPSGESVFLEGDTLIIISGEDHVIEQINDIFAD